MRAVQQRDQFIGLVLQTRQRLQQLYAQPLTAPQMRQRKAEEFERMREAYRQLRDQQWGVTRALTRGSMPL